MYVDAHRRARGGLDGLTVVTERPARTNPTRIAGRVPCRYGGPCDGVRATVLARVISRTRLEQHSLLPLYRRMGFPITPAISCPCV